MRPHRDGVGLLKLRPPARRRPTLGRSAATHDSCHRRVPRTRRHLRGSHDHTRRQASPTRALLPSAPSRHSSLAASGRSSDSCTRWPTRSNAGVTEIDGAFENGVHEEGLLACLESAKFGLSIELRADEACLPVNKSVVECYVAPKVGAGVEFGISVENYLAEESLSLKNSLIERVLCTEACSVGLPVVEHRSPQVQRATGPCPRLDRHLGRCLGRILKVVVESDHNFALDSTTHLYLSAKRCCFLCS